MPTHARRSFSLQALRKLGPALRSSRRELSDGTLCAFQLPRGPPFTCLGLVRGRRRPESSPRVSASTSVRSLSACRVAISWRSSSSRDGPISPASLEGADPLGASPLLLASLAPRALFRFRWLLARRRRCRASAVRFGLLRHVATRVSSSSMIGATASRAAATFAAASAAASCAALAAAASAAALARRGQRTQKRTTQNARRRARAACALASAAACFAASVAAASAAALVAATCAAVSSSRRHASAAERLCCTAARITAPVRVAPSAHRNRAGRTSEMRKGSSLEKSLSLLVTL